MGRRRQLKVRAAAAVTVTALVAVTGACSASRDTEQIGATANPKNTVVPSTSVVIGSVPSTTTTPPLKLASVPEAQDTLTALLSQFAVDPTLLEQISSLANGSPDLAAIANMLGIDLSAVQGLGLTANQIMSLGETVAASPDLVISKLSGLAPGGQIDPGMLIGLLTSSLDMNTLAKGAIGALVDSLAKSLGGVKIEITPQLTIKLSELLDQIDPDGLGQFSADPRNASLLALITSAVISANPLLAEQLLSNPLLDPGLKSLLVQLQDLSTNLSDAAKAAILLALGQMFPGLVPQIPAPGQNPTPGA